MFASRIRILAVSGAAFTALALTAGPALAQTGPAATPGHVELCADGDYTGTIDSDTGGFAFPVAHPGQCVVGPVNVGFGIADVNVEGIFNDPPHSRFSVANAWINAAKGAVIHMEGNTGDGGDDAYLTVQQLGVSGPPPVLNPDGPHPGYFNLCARGNYTATATFSFTDAPGVGGFGPSPETPAAEAGAECVHTVIAAWGDTALRVSISGWFNTHNRGDFNIPLNQLVNPYEGVTVDTLGTTGNDGHDAYLYVHQNP
jgi:hypothetical protein